MKLYGLLITIVLFGCGSHDSQDTTNPLDPVINKGAMYSKSISDSMYLARCDKLTFKATLSTYLPQNIENLEVAPGKWLRDVPDCYPKESASQVSFEGILGVLHHIWSTKDCAMATRLVDYGALHNWVMGLGPTAETDASLLGPTASDIQVAICNNESLMLTGSIDDVLSGYKGHILASWIWLIGRIDGHINDVEKEGLNQLVNAKSFYG